MSKRTERLKTDEAIFNFVELTLTCDPNAVNELTLSVLGEH